MSTREQAVWRPFVRASLGTAMVAGFGLGAALFLAAALDASLGLWWLAAAQAHGHAQLVGWAGLMVLGVGLHFLPRLLGASLYRPEWAARVLWLLLGGIVLRAIAQPALALADAGALRMVTRLGLAASGVLELAGVSLAIWLLGKTIAARPAARAQATIRAVLPFFVTSFSGLWIASALNAYAVGRAAKSGQALITPSMDRTFVQVAFYLFLIPVAMAMAARTFPLYLRTPPPAPRLLRAGLALLIAGLAARIIGDDRHMASLTGAGEMVLAIALMIFVAGLGVFARRLPLPRRAVRPLTDPIQLHVITAFGWLLVTAVLLLLRGSEAIGAPGWRSPLDAEWHALGAGFVTPLILGVGAHLLPGFARRTLRSITLVWVTLLLVNGAALLRIVPVLAGDRLSATFAQALAGSAGVAALIALVAFAINVEGPPVSSRPDASR